MYITNWTFDHDDHSPFGNEEHLQRNEFYSLMITILFFLLGLLGNVTMIIVNLYILHRSDQEEKRTFENLLLEISLFDLIILFYHLINSIIRYRSLEENDVGRMTGLINLSSISCKLLTYVIRIASLMSHWLIVILLLNRLFLVHSKFHRLIPIINAKYAVLALLFIFILFNVPSIESISFNDSTTILSNVTFSGHCLINGEMLDLHQSFHSFAVIFNVFIYIGVGLIVPTLIAFVLSIVLFRKGSQIWNDFHGHQNATENISLRSNSPIVEYLRTYKSVFFLAIVFVACSLPSKFLRLFVLFVSNDLEEISSQKLLFQFHSNLETIGHTFELAIYSTKCFICIAANHRFRCAMKYLCDCRRRSRQTFLARQRLKSMRQSHSDEGLPLDVLYRQLKINEFESPIHLHRTHLDPGLYSQRSSFKTRSSVSSRRTKEDEISL